MIKGLDKHDWWLDKDNPYVNEPPALVCSECFEPLGEHHKADCGYLAPEDKEYEVDVDTRHEDRTDIIIYTYTPLVKEWQTVED